MLFREHVSSRVELKKCAKWPWTHRIKGSIHIIGTYKSRLLWDDKIGRRPPPATGRRPKRRLLSALLILLLATRCEIIDKIIKWLLSKSIPECCYRESCYLLRFSCCKIVAIKQRKVCGLTVIKLNYKLVSKSDWER